MLVEAEWLLTAVMLVKQLSMDSFVEWLLTTVTLFVDVEWLHDDVTAVILRVEILQLPVFGGGTFGSGQVTIPV